MRKPVCVLTTVVSELVVFDSVHNTELPLALEQGAVQVFLDRVRCNFEVGNADPHEGGLSSSVDYEPFYEYPGLVALL